MSVLKIKDQNNNWTQIPTIKGEKGDPFTYADFTTEQLESLKGKDGISPTVSVASDTSDDYRLSFTDETHTVTTPNLIPEAEKILSVYPHDTASGAVASFPDGADDIPLKSCIVQIEPVQEGSGDPSPDNVRPISGFTGCEVQRTGKNLYPYESIPKYTYSWFSNYTFSGATHKVFLKANTDYVLSFETTDATQYVNIRVFDAFGTLVESADVFNALQGNNYPISYQPTRHCFALTGFVTYKFVQIKSTVDVWIDCVMSQSREAGTSVILELGSTPTDYEPYTGRTYPITFPSEAGTVYGAYVDATGGELVVDRATDDMGNLSWSTQGTAGKCYSTSKRDTIKKGTSAEGYDNAFAEIYSASNASGMSSLQANQMSVDSGGNIQLYDARFAGMTGAQIKAELQGVTMCYKLAEPIHYSLTPQEIKTLLGQNNIWADCGDTEVEYRADTKLYIDNLTRSTEDDMTANTNISKDAYFTIGNTLYKASTAISKGETIVPNTNCTIVSLADALNTLTALTGGN